jgi:hypothetical protein
MSFHSRASRWLSSWRANTTAAAHGEFQRLEKIEPEVENAAAQPRAVDSHVLFRQVPAAWTHEQHGGLVLQLVSLAFGRHIVDAAAYRVAQVELSLDVVVPLRRVRVLKVRHEHARTELSVDDHFAIDRSGDFHAAIGNIGLDRRAHPVGFAYRAGLGEEIRPLAGVEFGLARGATREQVVTPVAERALQPGDERQRLRRQNLGVLRRDGAGNFDAGAIGTRGHGVFWHGICGAQSECVVSRKKGFPGNDNR